MRGAHPPEVLRGDMERTRALIDSLDTTWRFTAGVLSWHPEDTVTPEQEQRVMDDFEAVAFAGLEEDQRAILWVRHRQHLQASSKNALATTENAILQSLAQLEQNISSRCRTKVFLV